MPKYYQQYGILDFYVMQCLGHSKMWYYLVDWYGNVVSKPMPYQFAVKLQNKKNKI